VVLNVVTPVIYESLSSILVHRGQQETAFDSRSKLVLPWEEELNSELETVRSSHILDMAQKVIDESGVRGTDGEPIRIDPLQLTSTTSGRSSVIYLRSKNTDPIAAQQIARAVTQAYTDFRLNVRGVPELDAFFREEIEGLRVQLEEWEQRRADFMNEESVARLDIERNSMIALRQQTEFSLANLRSELAGAEARAEVMRNLMDEDPDSADVPYTFSDMDNRDSEMIFQLKKELIARRAALVSARAQYQDDHPQVRTLTDEVRDLAALLRREVESYVRHLRYKVDVLKAQEEALLTSLSYTDASMASYPQKEAKLAYFDRIITAMETSHKSMVDKQIQARLERIGSSDWNVLVLQPATEPTVVRTNDFIRLLLIPLLGLVVGVALAFVVDGLDHSLKDATDAEQHLGLPVLGSIGRM